MTLQEIEQMKADREIGTDGPWTLIWHGNETYPFPLSLLTSNNDSWIARDGVVSSEANARRIARVPDMEKEILRLREALTLIDALDPETQINGVSHQALRGLVLKIGEIARNALNNTEM